MQVAWVRSLVGELESHRPCGMAKKFKKQKQKQAFQIHHLCRNRGPEDSAPSTRHQSLPPGSLHKPLDQINPTRGQTPEARGTTTLRPKKRDHWHRKFLGAEMQSLAYLIQWPERGPIFRNHHALYGHDLHVNTGVHLHLLKNRPVLVTAVRPPERRDGGWPRCGLASLSAPCSEVGWQCPCRNWTSPLPISVGRTGPGRDSEDLEQGLVQGAFFILKLTVLKYNWFKILCLFLLYGRYIL